jgi:hypothetical protein
MNNSTYDLNFLTKKEVTSILESLLFASSVDVVANWYKEDAIQMLDIAKKIRKTYPDILLENVYLYESKGDDLKYNDDHTNDIDKIFPDIRKEKIELV